MNKIKALIAALLISGTATPAVAGLSYERLDEVDDHVELLQDIENMGITVVVNNEKLCGGRDVAGFWHGARRVFALCQQEARITSGSRWNRGYRLSDDDMDTIRHEAHHIVQDCQDGVIDGHLRPYFANSVSRANFLAGYPDWKEYKIIEEYRESGSSLHVIKLEVEAWATADMISADSIRSVLRRECSA